MTKYIATFQGRRVNAIGKRHTITDYVEAPDEEAARLKLYDTYDHIMFLILTPVEDEPND